MMGGAKPISFLFKMNGFGQRGRQFDKTIYCMLWVSSRKKKTEIPEVLFLKTKINWWKWQGQNVSRDLPLGKTKLLMKLCHNRKLLKPNSRDSRFFYRILIFKSPLYSFFKLHIREIIEYNHLKKKALPTLIGLLIYVIRWLKNGRNTRRQWNQEMRN